MDAKLKELLLKLQKQEKDITRKAIKGGGYKDLIVGTFKLAQLNTVLTLKLVELTLQRDGDLLTTDKNETESSETVH